MSEKHTIEGLESGNAAVSRTVDDIDRDIAAIANAASGGDSQPGGEAVLPGGVSSTSDQGPAVPQKSQEKVLREFSMLVGLIIRLVKGIFAPAWKVEKTDIQELQELWADYLAEEFPRGVPATKLGFAITATASLIGAHADEPRFNPEESGKKVGFFQRLFKASAGK